MGNTEMCEREARACAEKLFNGYPWFKPTVVHMLVFADVFRSAGCSAQYAGEVVSALHLIRPLSIPSVGHVHLACQGNFEMAAIGPWRTHDC